MDGRATGGPLPGPLSSFSKQKHSEEQQKAERILFQSYSSTSGRKRQCVCVYNGQSRLRRFSAVVSGEVLTKRGRGLNTLPLSPSISVGSGCIWLEDCQAEAAKKAEAVKGQQLDTK